MAEQHNIPPVYDADSRVLILGSFPSVASRTEQFYYAHLRNRFWPVMSILLGCPVPESAEDKRDMLLRGHIALWDVIESCDVTGSADSSIHGAVPNDIGVILNAAPIRAIYCNGGTAHALYNRLLLPRTGIPAIKLPSTSPANAGFSLDRLTVGWRDAIGEI